MNDEPLRERTPEETQIIAYHEAGHAVAAYMFGKSNDIEYIDMRGYSTVNAFVNMRVVELSIFMSLPPKQLENPTVRAARDSALRYYILLYLMGHAAQYRFRPLDDDDYDHWLPFTEDYHLLDTERADLDTERAKEIALVVTGNKDTTWKLIWEIAEWADEAVQCEPVWRAIELLANELCTVRHRLYWEQISAILETAWKASSGLPYFDLGETWRKRFHVELPEVDQ